MRPFSFILDQKAFVCVHELSLAYVHSGLSDLTSIQCTGSVLHQALDLDLHMPTVWMDIVCLYVVNSYIASLVLAFFHYCVVVC